MPNSSGPAAPAVEVVRFELTYLDDEGAEQRNRLIDVGEVAFEAASPVRSFPSYHGQRNYPGLYWSASGGRHVGYESLLERDQAMLMDFDPGVVDFAAQPFWLHWHDGRRERRHAPDFFVRRCDGVGVVVDCRPADRVKPNDAAAFRATAQACAAVGWEYELVHGHDPVLVGNVRWLAGYRHPRHHDPQTAAALLEVFVRPGPLLVGTGRVGDPLGVLPVLYHLLWAGQLTVDLTVCLHEDSVVGPGAAG